MKSRPIMFSTLMVQALPHKTNTRRTRGLEIINEHPDQWKFVKKWDDANLYIFEHTNGSFLRIKCPFGVKGDGLWCKETWMLFRLVGSDVVFIHYKADGQESPLLIPEGFDRAKLDNKLGKIQSAMFMFRWACRHLLENTADPIPQRLWNITKEDAIAEGIEAIWQSPDEETNKALRNIGAKEVTEPYIIGYKNYLYKADKRFHYGNPHGYEYFSGEGAAIESYASLWDSINYKKYPWSGNYWAWKLAFKEIAL